MTPEEMKAKTAEKVEKVKALCQELQLVLQAEQAVLDNGLIKNIIYYMDTEEYPKKVEVVHEAPHSDEPVSNELEVPKDTEVEVLDA
jgi:hypothetical protein